MKKKHNWDKIKIDYLSGKSPKELCKKYKINNKTLDTHINKGKWKNEKDEIKGKSRGILGEKIALSLAEEQEEYIIEQKKNAKSVLVKFNLLLNTIDNAGDLKSLTDALDKANRIIRQALNMPDEYNLNVNMPRPVFTSEVKDL